MEDKLLTQLKNKVSRDLKPVRPLAEPGLRALWWLAVSFFLGMLSLLLFGPRQDLPVLGLWKSLGFSVLQVVLCLALLRISLRSSIPGLATTNLAAGLWVFLALLVQLFFSWSVLRSSAVSPPAGQEWATGLACTTGITALSLLPLIVAGVLLSQGLLTRFFPTLVLTGTGAGLLAEAVWRLHCVYSSWSHVVPFHTGTLALPLLIAIVLGAILFRRPLNSRQG